MSLQITGQGTLEGVLKHIEAQYPKPAEGPDKLPHGTDREQVEAVKALLASEIKAIKGVNGCRIHVEASAHNGGRNIQLVVVPFAVHT